MISNQANPALRYIRKVAATEHARTLSDQELLDRFISQREEAAFAALVRRHGPMVLRLCRATLHNEHDAEDAFQATFLVLNRKATSLRPRDSLSGWLFSVAHRTAQKAKVAAARRHAHEMRAVSARVADPGTELTLQEAREILHRELARLPVKFQAPLVLCYLEGLTRDEAARQLGWSPTLLKGRLEQARKRLRERLASLGLALSGALAATLFQETTISAAVPATLLSSTAKAVVASEFAMSPAVSAQAVALAEGVLKAKSLSKLLIAMTVLLLAGVGLGAAVRMTRAAADGEVEKEAAPVADSVHKDSSSAQTPGAQKPMTAMEANNYVQQLRNEASDLWEQKEPSTKDLEKAIKILEGLVTFLEEPQIVDFANGVSWMRSRKSNVYADLAAAHVRLGHKKAALDYLRKLMEDGDGTTVKMLNWWVDVNKMAVLREEQGFKDLVKKYEWEDRLWSGAAFQTPYKENLSDDEKIAGLSLFWSRVKDNFVHFDHVPDLDWDKLYLATLPRVRETKSTLEYYQVLMEMCAQLKDGHTNVYPPKELQHEVYARPPVRTALIEDKVLIVEVRSASLREKGIRPGLEIVKIDGLPTREYAEKRVAPYACSSTKQDLQVRTFTYGLLSGAKDKPVELELSDEKGEKVTKTLARSGYTDVDKGPPQAEFKVLRGNVGYLAVREFENDACLKCMEDNFDKIASTDALIVDVRDNGGGSSGFGYEILAYLTDKHIKLSAQAQRVYRSADQVWREGEQGGGVVWDRQPGTDWYFDKKKLYSKPVVVLTSARTFSAAEDFCVAFDYMKRGKIIGEPTGGSTGQPLGFALPGGGSARVCAKHDSYPDGKEFVGIGIQPQVLIRPTIADVRADKDTVLEGAIDHLLKASPDK